MSIIIDPISPVAFSLFGFDVRWYALSYVAGFVLGYVLFARLMRGRGSAFVLTKKQMDDCLTYVILGVILGGRLGYVLFYNLAYFIAYPLEVFAVWNGGMSFHGALIGVIAAVFLYGRHLARKNEDMSGQGTYIRTFKILDLMAVCAPIGLFFGRIANFINMEVMGRPTDSAFGVIFRGMGDVAARHPSPLYEAATEGAALFIIMFCLQQFTRLQSRVGALSGVAAMLYATFRIACEQFRAPDVQVGFLTSWGLTMGQLLSAGVFIFGLTIFIVAFRKK